MANTYSQIYIQIVFAVKYRQSLIMPTWEDELYKYICGIIRNKNHIPIAVNGVANHIHILIAMRPIGNLSELVREIKKATTHFINDNHLTRSHFQWQEGFGAFSYHRSMLPTIVRYINNQKEHHRTTTFRDEYYRLLDEFKIKHDEKYLFEWIDDNPTP